jgi:hypothetical protein
MATPGLEIYSISHHVPLEQLSALLKLGNIPTAELSVVEWNDQETVMDELATFFPFGRYFIREWEGVKDALAEQVEKGKLVLVRGISAEAVPNLGTIIDYVANALHSSKGAVARAQGRIVFVLENFGESGIQGQGKLHPVTKLDVPVSQGRGNDGSVFKLQVSGKRNHTYYVNVALKVLARRPWHAFIELSGLGNAIPAIVSIAEILKRYRVAVVENIETSLVELSDEGRKVQKTKMVVLLKKSSSSPVIPEDDSEQTI